MRWSRWSTRRPARRAIRGEEGNHRIFQPSQAHRTHLSDAVEIEPTFAALVEMGSSAGLKFSTVGMGIISDIDDPAISRMDVMLGVVEIIKEVAA